MDGLGVTAQVLAPFLGAACLFNISRVSVAQRPQLKPDALRLPFSLRLRLVSSLSRICSIEAAMPAIEPGSKYSRTPPETSGKHDRFETIVGTPQAMASTIGKQNPSYIDGMTTRLAPLISIARSDSSRAPVRRTRPGRPSPLWAADTMSSYSHPRGPAKTKSNFRLRFLP